MRQRYSDVVFICQDLEETTQAIRTNSFLETNRNGSPGYLDDAEVHKISCLRTVLLPESHYGGLLRNWHRIGHMYETRWLHRDHLWHHCHQKCPNGIDHGADCP